MNYSRYTLSCIEYIGFSLYSQSNVVDFQVIELLITYSLLAPHQFIHHINNQQIITFAGPSFVLRAFASGNGVPQTGFPAATAMIAPPASHMAPHSGLTTGPNTDPCHLLTFINDPWLTFSEGGMSAAQLDSAGRPGESDTFSFHTGPSATPLHFLAPRLVCLQFDLLSRGPPCNAMLYSVNLVPSSQPHLCGESRHPLSNALSADFALQVTIYSAGFSTFLLKEVIYSQMEGSDPTVGPLNA